MMAGRQDLPGPLVRTVAVVTNLPALMAATGTQARIAAIPAQTAIAMEVSRLTWPRFLGWCRFVRAADILHADPPSRRARDAPVWPFASLLGSTNTQEACPSASGPLKPLALAILAGLA